MESDELCGWNGWLKNDAVNDVGIRVERECPVLLPCDSCVVDAPISIADVIAASKTDAFDYHPHQITTTVDKDTGEVVTYDTKLALPWIAWDTHGDVGMYGGMKNGQATVRLEAEQGLFSVKAIHVGIKATLDQEISPDDGSNGVDYFLGIGAAYKW